MRRDKRIHFIGVGGIGMSGIALVLLETGYKISGSDLEMNNLTEKIENGGAKIFKGHRPSNVLDDVGLAVYSSSVSKDNPEIVEANRRGIPVVHRAKVLGELLNKKKGIAITGTHGKTTTTSLVSVILENAGLDPTVIIGGEVKRFDGNAKSGKGKYLVAEADESDSSFTCLKPFYSVITNIEPEHIDHYKTLDDAKEAYLSFAKNLKKSGKIFYNYDDDNVTDVINDPSLNSKNKESFGFSEKADIYPSDIKMNGFKISFKCVYKNKPLGTVNLKIPGRHNVLNALAAISVGLNAGIKFKKITDAVKGFDGAKRRFHLRSQSGGIMLIDDYAHHPTEIKAVLEACRNWKRRRLIAIFQPHRYTRTRALADEFGRCFDKADKLILTDIYAASEEPIEGVSVKNIYDRVKRNGLRDVTMVKKEDLSDYVMNLKSRGDMILVLGAGDIKKIADELAGRFNMDELIKSFKGAVRVKERLAAHTSFKIGGPADIWAEPEDEGDLKNLLKYTGKNNLPVFVIGNGSNLLIKENGFKGVVIKLGRAGSFGEINIKGTTIKVGGGRGLARLVRDACAAGLAGLESLVGIPGTVGGAIFMNAGGSTNPIFKNIGDFVTSLRVMDYDGNTRRLTRQDIDFGYRRSNLNSYIILEATLRLRRDDRGALLSRRAKFLKMKREKQALDVPSAGCVFKNPQDSQFSCGQMIDMLGLKGKRIGAAEVSTKHANFIVNRGGASCDDVLKLAGLIRDKVRENYAVDLDLEIKVV